MGEGYDFPEQHQAGAGSNPLGIVGFILSFCLSPLGLLISLFALFKAPRGFAIGGVIVGLIGTVIWAVLGAGVYFGAGPMREMFQAVSRVESTRQAIEAYQARNDGALPEDLAALGLEPATTTDPWGTPFRFQRSEDGASYTLTIAGPDGTFDDGKDVTVTPTMTPDQIGEAMGNTFGEELMRRRMGGGAGGQPTP